MNMQEIRKIAKGFGIKTKQVKKLDLVRNIQLEEGNFDCFSTAEQGYCDQPHCLWKTDCMEMSKKKLPKRTLRVKPKVKRKLLN